MGIQISGLLSGQAFDWKSVVDQLIAADSIPITTLQTEESKNNDKISALGDVYTSLGALQDSLQAIRANNSFDQRSVISSDTASSWKSTSSEGAPLGSYTFNVTQLATAASVVGTSDIGAGIAPTADVTGVTLANMNTATAVTAGTFTVAGQQVTIATTDSLQNVFDKISTATSGAVTGSYDPTADKVTLTSSSGELLLGATNDTSNFLQVLKLANSGTSSATSSGPLGIVKTSATLASADLRTTPTAVDGSGNGTFSINNVSISYNVNTDTLSSVMDRINQSSAGVTASYDSSLDRMILTNKNTGDTAISLSESSGGLLAALGVTSTGFQHGKNAQFTVNGGATLTSPSNTLDASVHGITGLSVIVNSTGSQTLTVESDTTTMQSAIQDFLDKFNAVQDMIDAKTKVTTTAGSTSTSVLSDNREIQDWARQLQQMAFNTVSGVTGSVTKLDDLGIDFDGTTGHLIIKDSGKFNAAIANKPADVKAYFNFNGQGQVPQMYGYLTNVMTSDTTQQDNIRQANSDIDNQITTMQSRIDNERTQLTNSFIAMLDAQSAAQSQNQSLTSTFFNNNSGSCWVARAVYGPSNPRWLLFRHWLLGYAPAWFRSLYLRHGERFAGWLQDKAWLKRSIRRWMDARIAGLPPR